MIREEVVFYLKTQIGKFPLKDIKAQLLSEGVSEEEFKAALKAAQRLKNRQFFGRGLMATGGLALFSSIFFILARRPPPRLDDSSSPVFLSPLGYVVSVPEGFVAIKTAASEKKETIYFCKKGTDPSAFLDRGLYGQLGIIKLKVLPSPFSQDPRSFSRLSNLVLSQAKADGSPFQAANLNISEMQGLQIDFSAPTSRVMSYILGSKNLYIFLAGPNDPHYPEILHSLRETQSQ